MDIQDEIKRKLRDVCDRQFDGSESRMAQAMGIPQGGMWRFMNENTGLSMMTIQRIFDFLGGRISFDPAEGARFVSIPMYRLDEELIPLLKEEPLVFRKRWLQKLGEGKFNELIACEIEKDDMSPTLESGDVVLIAKSEEGRKLVHGFIYVVKVNDQYLIKRYTKGFDGSLIFLSDNRRMLWEDFQINPDQLNLLEVIGRVIWIGRELVK
jgi:hypothetical protein